jgi:diguanylate cyclase (GGDEF)-like protein
VEFKKKYTAISLQRGKLFIWVTFFIAWYSLFTDLILKRDNTIDLGYRQNLLAMHVAILVLSIVYIIAYNTLERSEKYRFSGIAKFVVLSHMFLTLLVGAVLAVNSQRFTGNIEVYVLVILAVALVVPMYPRWVLGIYGMVHISFLIVLSALFKNNSILIKQFNSTAIVFVSLVLFLMLYQNNVKNFLAEEMLREDKATFIKLFETNPFPLMIFRFADGKILYANQKAMLFYEIPEDQLSTLNHNDLYKDISDLHVIRKMIEINEKVNDYMVEQKTTTGKIKRLVINYELIDYFGEKSILSGVADIAEIKRIEHELTIHASTDILTGVLNRRVGMDLVRRRYETVGRESGQFTLCFIDIDDLKAVNDQYGHLEGDSLITVVCRIIGEEINPNDVLFRYGGDEFVVLFGDEEKQQIDQISRRIAKRYEDLNQNHYKPYFINATMGTFTYQSEMNLDLEQIIEIVDRNMYNNKLRKK